MGFGLRGQDIADAIKHLATLQGNQAALEQIREATTSCIHWGGILQELMQKDSIKYLFVREFNKPMQLCQIENIGDELRAGKAVLVAIKLPDCDQHIFCIEPRADGRRARIVHAWQDVHSVRAERNMPIEEIMDHIKGLWSSDCVADGSKLQNIFKKLFGADAQFNSNGRPVRQRISFETVLSGRPERPLDEIGSRQRLSSLLSEMSDWQSGRLSRSSGTSGRQSACSSRSSIIPDEPLAPVPSKVGMIRTGTAVGAALGFVFGVGGVLWSGERDPKEVALAGTKSTLGGAASGAAGAAAAKYLTPTFGRIGTSLVRANVLSGVAFFSVFAIWDVVEWKVHKITDVQLRQRMAEGAAGAAGGIGGGAAAGVGFGLLFGPIGAVVGGIVGGLAGGIGGAFAGKAIDGAIWDESEDSVMNMYEFFGWRDVKRNTRPVKTAEEMGKAYDKKLESRPSKIKEEDWDRICTASIIVLLQAMYPVFIDVMKMADNLQKNRSDGVSAVGTAMYQSISEE
ncbi:uncharacterized protein LOC118217572 isoform X2 [Anguilla anguilla]|uniref:uncharacterized protein LOC118217572 isoform X2 n=1 Tax=Anguilla anguilla TaxID=7936 RepID=UPI0015B26338|nr:uncharacterized protein LOC118217572 isoform X2 [Anguilla anguilla]